MLMYCGHIPHCTNITARKGHVLHKVGKIQYRYRYSMLGRYKSIAKVRYLCTLPYYYYLSDKLLNITTSFCVSKR